jgi:hypothetical protein
VIESVPTGREEVLNVALPLLNAPVPTVVEPFLKVTVPVGVPAPGETAPTAAVRVTDVPDLAEDAEEARDTVVLALLTVCLTLLLVLPA